MLTHGSLAKASTALGEGFFADEVVKSLRTEETVNAERRDMLNETKDYIDRIERGRAQVSTGRLSGDAVEANTAYGRMLRFIMRQAPTTADRNAVQRFIKAMEKEVDDALHTGKIEPDKLMKTREFFQYVREATLRDSASTFGWESEELSKPTGIL